MYNEVIRLLNISRDSNASGDLIETITDESDVFASIKSVGMRETYEAMAIGLKPEFAFEIADYLDYNGQTYLTYDFVRWKILRTYRKGTKLEIVVTR